MFGGNNCEKMVAVVTPQTASNKWTQTQQVHVSLLIIRQIHVHPNFVAFLLEENISHCVVIFTLELQLKTLSLSSHLLLFLFSRQLSSSSLVYLR